jgi:DNA-directed RNA polymerase specialized sigma24 family protein
MNETSLSLLDRARNDPHDGSWQRLADLYTPLVRGWLARMGVPSADADDLLHETLLTVTRELRDVHAKTQ